MSSPSPNVTPTWREATGHRLFGDSVVLDEDGMQASSLAPLHGFVPIIPQQLHQPSGRSTSVDYRCGGRAQGNGVSHRLDESGWVNELTSFDGAESGSGPFKVDYQGSPTATGTRARSSTHNGSLQSPHKAAPSSLYFGKGISPYPAELKGKSSSAMPRLHPSDSGNGMRVEDDNNSSFTEDGTQQSFFTGGNSGVGNLPQLTPASGSRRNSLLRNSSGNTTPAVPSLQGQHPVKQGGVVAIPDLSTSSVFARGISPTHQSGGKLNPIGATLAGGRLDGSGGSIPTPQMAVSNGKMGEPPEEFGDYDCSASASDHAAASSSGRSGGRAAAHVAVGRERNMSRASPALPDHTAVVDSGTSVPAAPAQAKGLGASVQKGDDGGDVGTAPPNAVQDGITSAERKEAKRVRKEAREARHAAKEARRAEKQQRKQAKEQRKADATPIPSTDTQRAENSDPAELPAAATTPPAEDGPSAAVPAVAVAGEATTRPPLPPQRSGVPPLQTSPQQQQQQQQLWPVSLQQVGSGSASLSLTNVEAEVAATDSARYGLVPSSTGRRTPHPPSFGVAGSSDDFSPAAIAKNDDGATSGGYHPGIATPIMLAMGNGPHPPSSTDGSSLGGGGGTELNSAAGELALADTAAATTATGSGGVKPELAAEQLQGPAAVATPHMDSGYSGSFDDDRHYREQFVGRQASSELNVRGFVQAKECASGARHNNNNNIPSDNDDSETTGSRQVSSTYFGLRLTEGSRRSGGGVGRAPGGASRERAVATRPRTVYSSEGGTATQQARAREDEEVNVPSEARRRLRKRRKSHRRRHQHHRSPAEGEGEGMRRADRRHRRKRHSRQAAAPAAASQKDSKAAAAAGPVTVARLPSTNLGTSDADQDTPPAFHLIITGANGEAVRALSSTARPFPLPTGGDAAPAFFAATGNGQRDKPGVSSSAVVPHRSVGAGCHDEEPRPAPHSTLSRPVGLDSGSKEPSPPNTTNDGGRQHTQFVRRQHVACAPASGPHERDPEKPAAGDRASPPLHPHPPPAAAGSAAAAVVELQRRRDRHSRSGSDTSTSATSESESTMSSREMADGSASCASSPARAGKPQSTQKDTAAAVAVVKPQLPLQPRSGGGRSGRGRGKGSRAQVAQKGADTERRPVVPVSSSISGSSSTSSSDSWRDAAGGRSSEAKGISAPPPPAATATATAATGVNAKATPSGQAALDIRKHAPRHHRDSSSEDDSFSPSSSSFTDSVGSSYSSGQSGSGSSYGSYSTSTSSSDDEETMFAAARLSLKAGFTTPPPEKAFTSVSYRLANPSVLQPYAEPAVIYEWNRREGCWDRVQTYVVLSPTPFSHGKMRASYHMADLKRLNCKLIAKRYLKASVSDDQYFDDVSMHSIADHWARLYNTMGPPKKVKFVPAAVLELPERQPPLILAMEPQLEGTFRKYNNNYGFVPRNARWTPQTFSHFTYHASHHTQLIVDIQGVDDIYTDPQILSPDGRGFGRGNLARKGIRRFLKTHRCNGVCRALGLPDVNKSASPPSGSSTGVVSPNTRLASSDFDAFREERLPPKSHSKFPHGGGSAGSAHPSGASNGLSSGQTVNNVHSRVGSSGSGVGAPGGGGRGPGAASVTSVTTGLPFSPSPPPHAVVGYGNQGQGGGGGGLLSPNHATQLMGSFSPAQAPVGVHNPKFMKHIRHQLSRQQSSRFTNGVVGGGGVPSGYPSYSSSAHSDNSNPPSRGPGTPNTAAAATPVLFPPSNGVSGGGGSRGGMSIAQQQQQQVLTPMGSTPHPLVLPLSSMEVKPPTSRHMGNWR